MATPKQNTTREALIAELLGDVAGLVEKVEALPSLLEDKAEAVSKSAAAIDEATENYQAAAKRFSEQAKKDLAQFSDSQMKAAGNQAKEEVKAAAISALNDAGYTKASRLFEYLIIAIATSCITIAIFSYLLKNGYFS